MRRHPSESKLARQAYRSIAAVGQKLLNPTTKTLESCEPHLRAAIDSLARLQGQLARAGARGDGRIDDANLLRAEMSRLQHELKDVNALMSAASAFYISISGLGGPCDDPQRDDSIRYGSSGVVVARPVPTMLVEG